MLPLQCISQTANIRIYFGVFTVFHIQFETQQMPKLIVSVTV